ncbi:MAG: ferritin [Thermodesulfobacteriota bacterium]
MISKEMQEALNNQISNEYFSSYTYLSMSAYCESINMQGFAAWLRRQSKEELEHALKIFDYVLDRNGKVNLKAIEQPPSKFSSLLKMFQQAFEHEREVTGMINKLYELALNEGDHATAVQMQWFITEQVEEEKNALNLVEKLRLAGENGSALLILDRQLADSTPK